MVKYLEIYKKDEDKTKENKYKDIDYREGYNEYIKSHKVITMEEEKNLKEYKDIIMSFLEGELDIISFRKIYDTQPGVNDYLQLIIDKLKTKHKKRFFKKRTSQDRPLSVVSLLISPEKDPGIKYGCPPRYTSVRQCLNYEYRMITHNVETAEGALKFYNEVYEIYSQVDNSIKYYSRYSDEYSFALDVIPRYLCGGEAEMYIQKHIIPLYPSTMKKEDRKKAIRAKIKEEFKSEKGYPRWIQESEWPLDKEGKPATYIGKEKCENETCRYLFRDEKTKEIIEIEQYY